MKAEIFYQPPNDFNINLVTAGCFCEVENCFLILKRSSSKPQGQTWNVPGGKLEAGETPRIAVIREVWEEAGIDIDSKDLCEIGTLYMRLPKVDYVFHVFHIRFLQIPSVDLNLNEHDVAKWVTVQQALKLPMILGGVEAIQVFESYSANFKGRTS